jgi:hypothetical protein
MEANAETGRTAPLPTSSAPEQQQHHLSFRPLLSPLARAHSNTSLGPVVTPTKEGGRPLCARGGGRGGTPFLGRS